MNPTSQLNFITLEKVVTDPKDEPLVGEDRVPQSTARKDEENLTKSYALNVTFLALCIDVSIKIEC